MLIVRALSAVALAVLVASPTLGFDTNEFGFGDNDLTRETMAGMGGVGTSLIPFSPGQIQAGFRVGDFQGDLLRKLRTAGIRIPGVRELLGDQFGTIYLRVNSTHDRLGQGAPFSITIQLWQRANLRRTPQRAVRAATWQHSVVGFGDVEYVRRETEYAIDKFISAWHSVNPKEGLGSAE